MKKINYSIIGIICVTGIFSSALGKECEDCQTDNTTAPPCGLLASPACSDDTCKAIPGSSHANIRDKKCFAISSGNGSCSSEANPPCGNAKTVSCSFDEATGECKTGLVYENPANPKYHTCTR